ncbi:Gfo/Idh/MocA family oxidoreductase [Candidatus Pelagibacter sp.]|nr:Gfo/Idh/MocA family oxidoreductase [Candidatus Pelagibacter sp.]
MMKNFALVGCGYWGTIIINTLKKINKFNFIYICDQDSLKTKIIKERFGSFVKIISIKELIENDKLKYVYLATPPSKNFKLIKKILTANKNILLEKPGFSKLIEFKIIKNLLLKTKSKIRFGYIYLYNDYIKYLKKLIIQKKIGKIKYISFQRQNFGPIRNDVNSFLDLATHDLSILSYLLNQKIIPKKTIKHDVLRKNSGDIFFANFVSGTADIDIHVSWLNPEKVRKITIITEKKMILYDEMDLEKPIKIFDNYASYPKISKYSKSYFTKKAFVYKGKSKFVKLKDKMPLNSEILSFIKNKDNITDIKFAEDIIKITKKLKII